jgi:hypothetical protein
MLHLRLLKRLLQNVRWAEQVARTVEKLVGKYLFWRPEPTWEINIKMGSRIRCWQRMNRIEEAQDEISGVVF